jgi:UDP-glucose 4-epimerase
MRVLVTGSTGFIGRHAVASLAAAGHYVISSSRGARGPATASRHVLHDFASPDPFPEIGAIDAVVHLAGDGNVQRAMANPADIARVNAQGTLHSLLLAGRHDATFVLASSQRVYRPRSTRLAESAPTIPSDPYGYSKLAAELYVQMAGRLFGLRGAVLRFFTVYGPGQFIASGLSGVVGILGQSATAGRPMVVMSHQRKDLVNVSDAVQGIELALERPAKPPRPYNVATGVATSVLDLARALRAVADSSSEIIEDYSEGNPGDLVADIGRARRELGYQPRVQLKEGLHRYVEWLRESGPHPA